jgi:SAM-dependent methyltransferase
MPDDHAPTDATAKPPSHSPIDAHTQIILDRYADRENIRVVRGDARILIDRYLSKVLAPHELRDQVILELGAGATQYVPVFMQSGCKRYYANDLIPERLTAVRVDDQRYIEIPGDFRTITVPEPVDIVIASLTMMFIMPMRDEFLSKIRAVLKPGGTFISMDPNYCCPLSIYRRFADRGANPARVFNPFNYASAARKHGFIVEKLIPFTAPLPWTTGNWALGTTFWLRARAV